MIPLRPYLEGRNSKLSPLSPHPRPMPQTMQKTHLYIGLMSGTSMDGVDAVLCHFPTVKQSSPREVLGHVHLPYAASLRSRLLALQYPSTNELHHAALLGNELADLYAEAIAALLSTSGKAPAEIEAIGCHGQTIRHQPALGYTLQIGNLARLAERTSIRVIGDFRSRDVAANGQGAPLIPAFHAYRFSDPDTALSLVNIGGMSNLTRLHPDKPIIGFDCGPGNVLMDAWVHEHLGQPFDTDGQWAAKGVLDKDLLTTLMNHPFLSALPPKSCGREQFDLPWLKDRLLLQGGRLHRPQDVQATLLTLTVQSIAEAIRQHCPETSVLMVCGGGARNRHLMTSLEHALPELEVRTTKAAGLREDLVEASAFAWLAYCFDHNIPSNLPAVTGAQGPRILGACYPA